MLFANATEYVVSNSVNIFSSYIYACIYVNMCLSMYVICVSCFMCIVFYVYHVPK